MKRTAAIVILLAFFLSACIPGLLPQQQPQEAPVLDVRATDEVIAATLVAETLNALPTPTFEPATNTHEPPATKAVTITSTGTATNASTNSASAIATLETGSGTATGTPPTSTATVTGTPPTATLSTTPSPTETMYARFYGTLPPSIPYQKVKLVNKAKADVYVSLRCTTKEGLVTIIEYPVGGRMQISAPIGTYSYVAWVGGRQFLGWFNLNKSKEVEITFERNKVTVK